LTRGRATDEGAVYYPYNPAWEGIVYWNDMMEPFSNDLNALAPPPYNPDETELVIDETYIGWLQDVDGNGVIEMEGILPIRTYGSSTQPAITVDEYGQRFVIWAANTEGFVYTGGDAPANYKHIWARAYANTVWGDFMDVTNDISHIFDDCVYPMIGASSDANIHYIYQTDIAPGNGLDGDHDYHDNFWVYGMLPKSDLITGIAEQELINDSHVSQNFPNPFNATSTVNVELEEASNLSLVVTNMTGQKVLEINKGNVPAQTHTFTIDASNLQSGIYFYTVTAGNSQVTRKMIVE
ncbi:MAG: T9SS type A sorting domain-containing protein, partial [Bacteroidales bacterium]|nr:T9SS type A sorting domain-containing protein [Bacteroidales bacterium]